VIKGKSLFSAPKDKVLDGVTRKSVLQVALQNGYEFFEKEIGPLELSSFDGAFLTSTSSKIMPIKKFWFGQDTNFSQKNFAVVENLETFEFGQITANLKMLMRLYDQSLDLLH